MRCLWLTLADPCPAHNGQYVYSGGLIESLAATGAELLVLGLKRPESHRGDGAREGSTEWWLADYQPHSYGARLRSPLS